MFTLNFKVVHMSNLEIYTTYFMNIELFFIMLILVFIHIFEGYFNLISMTMLVDNLDTN